MQFTGFSKSKVITPSDANPVNLGFGVKAVYVGGTGNITYRPNGHPTIMGVAHGADVLISAIPVGSILPISPRFVRATGTTATLLVGLGD